MELCKIREMFNNTVRELQSTPSSFPTIIIVRTYYNDIMTVLRIQRIINKLLPHVNFRKLMFNVLY